MLTRLLGALRSPRLGQPAEARAAVHSGAGLFLACALLLTSGAQAATPIGTVISNTAEVSYSHGVIHGLKAVSNTEQFPVEGLGVTDSIEAETGFAQGSATVWAGESLTFDITLTNSGDNALTGGVLHLHGPAGSSLEIPDLQLQAQKPRAAAATPAEAAYGVPDLPPFESITVNATLTVPPSAGAGDDALHIEYHANGKTFQVQEITLHILARTAATLELLQHDAEGAAPAVAVRLTEYDRGGSFTVVPVPAVPGSGQLVTEQPLPLVPSATFSHGQTLFLRVLDGDQNRDPAAIDTVTLTLDVAGGAETETLRLRETAADSGEFVGYLSLSAAPAAARDGVLNVTANAELTARYTDSIDASDSTVAAVLVDPYGRVFDSDTGAPLDGFTVQLVRAADGQGATVYGDDGVSQFPATVVSGGSVADSGGTVYSFAAGSYRFPFVAPGEYRLIVTPPAGSAYRGPSAKSDAALAAVPGGPFAIDLGSRGETFTVKAGPPLRLDIPMDPLGSALYVRRTAGKDQVAAGDFLPFEVTVENTSQLAAISAVGLTDTLPHGFRYRKGSARLNGAKLADPAIDGTGHTLSFALGDLPAAGSASVRYIAEVGAARPGQATSQSQARGNAGAVVSNLASLATTVREELLRSRNVLMGRVRLTNPEPGTEALDGIAGVRIYLEDGSYTVTDERGRFHFEGVKPGTHVVQLDLDTLPAQYEAIPFERNTRFAGRAWSQFVDLQGGTLWRVDFHVALKPKQQGAVQLMLGAEPAGERLHYELALSGQTVPVRNPRLMLMLPEGTHYIYGSSTLDGQPLPDPEVQGNILSYRLPDASGDWAKRLRLATALEPAPEQIELVAKALLSFDTPQQTGQRTPVAEHATRIHYQVSRQSSEHHELQLHYPEQAGELTPENRARLDRLAETLRGKANIHVEAIGYSDNLPVPDRTRDAFAAKRHRSAEQARQIVSYLQEQLALTPTQTDYLGRGPDQPLAGNDTPEGRAANRRVELRIYAERQEHRPELTADPAISQQVETTGQRPGEPWPGAQASTAAAPEAPRYDERWLATAAPGIEWLSPAANALPAIPSVDVAIKHAVGQKVELHLNGAPVPAVNLDGTRKNTAGTALSRWSGVDLATGENRFEALITDTTGTVVERLERGVHLSGPPARAELVAERSQLIADGIDSPVIAIRLLDRAGYPARTGVIGEYRVNPPYQPLREDRYQGANLAGAPAEKHTYVIEEGGIALIRLQPTAEAGEVQIDVPLEGKRSERLTARLTPQSRDWILVGLAEGTAGYNTVSGHSEPLTGSAAEDHLYQDDRIAFFAKGQVLGKWLLTLAYDSTKEAPAAQPGLYQTIDPGSYYTLYADNTTQGYEAASSKKLYVKLERDQFYALFGDYDTGLTQTELAQYSRNLTGLKARYQDGTYDVIVFSSESHQAFVRDELRGTGLTGPYRLTRDRIVMNSERVAIEVRDRFHSEVIVERRELARHSEYDIDYDRGTLTFREPVFSVDAGLNPVFIVVGYESFSQQDQSLTAGGRAAKQLSEDLQVGLTHVEEGRSGGEAKLSGIDARYQLAPETEARVELARSSDHDPSLDADGSAYLAEILHRGARWDGRAYLREQDEGFGLGQTSGAESGTHKLGAEASYRASERLTLTGQSYRQENLATDATRDLIEAQGSLQLERSELRLGARSTRDELGDGSEQSSNQITAGASRRVLDNKLNLRIDREQSLGSAQSVDFPTRTRLGADYLLGERTSLFAEQEWADGEVRDTRNTRVGLKTTPWEDAEAFTTVNRQQGSTGEQTSAGVGLRQRWRLDEAWSLDLGAEQSKLLSQSPGSPLDADVPFASGPSGGDATAGSFGATYNPGQFLWTARAEARVSDVEDSWRLATAAQTEPSADLGLLASLSVYTNDSAGGAEQQNINLGLGLAYRPAQGRWLVLDKLELIRDKQSGGAFEQRNWRIVNNLNTHYRVSDRWQLAVQYGAKYLVETIDGQSYSGYLDLTGIEGRYDITEKWDIGLQGSVLHSWKTDQYDYSTGVSVGHTFVKNVWLSLGYNITGFRDEDFSRYRYTSEGPYLKFRIKFDQQSVREAVKWAGQ